MSDQFEGPVLRGQEIGGWTPEAIPRMQEGFEVYYDDIRRKHGFDPTTVPGDTLVELAIGYGNHAEHMRKIQRQPYYDTGVPVYGENFSNKILPYYIGEGEDLMLSKKHNISVRTIDCTLAEENYIMDCFNRLGAITGFEMRRVLEIKNAVIDIHLQNEVDAGRRDVDARSAGTSLPGKSHEQYWRTILWTRAGARRGPDASEDMRKADQQIAIMHELGHAFGLSHPGFNQTGFNQYYNKLDTLMSYIDPQVKEGIDPKQVSISDMPLPEDYNELEASSLKENFSEFLQGAESLTGIIDIKHRDEGLDWLYEGGDDAYTARMVFNDIASMSDEFDYSYHGINGKEDICGTGIDDVIYSYGGNDRLYLTPGFDLISTGKGRDKIYITAESILATDSYTFVEDFNPKKDQLALDDVDEFAGSLDIIEIGNCAALVFDSSPVAIFNGVTFDEFMQADIPRMLLG
ncbi:hypothetical protein PMIT1342_00962 [Prochlorococcus marinus str. MIT 1342]|nr:hypothetical protein [Prochlorococcus marinus]KZR82492.1 hypothetical protein PMIT1342_00962 [Prochlorococcus marinus str. MIT 1342]